MILALVARLALAAPALPRVAPPAPPAFPVPTVLHLSSGAPVWLVQREGLPLLRVEVSLRGGMLAADDPLALQAAGALLAEGALDRPAAARDAALADLGATLDLGVGTARAWGDVEALTGSQDAALALLSEALAQPALPRPALRRLREGWRRAQDRAPTSADAVGEAALARATLPADHPLATRFGPGDVRWLGRWRVRRAWRRQLSGSAAAIVVVGDVQADALLPLLERHLGWLPAGPLPPPLPPAPPPEPRRVLVDLPGLSVARLQLALPAPPAGAPEDAAADLVVHALCGAFTSRLNQRLREAEGLTYGVHCAREARPGFGRLVITVPVAPEDVGRALAAMEAELDRAAADLPTPPELEAAARSLWRAAAHDQLQGARVAWRLGAALTAGQPADAVASGLAAAGRVTPAEAHAVARHLLDPAHRVWLVLGDAARLEPALDAAGRAPDHRWSGAAVVAP